MSAFVVVKKAPSSWKKFFRKNGLSKINRIPHTALKKIITQTILQNFYKKELNPKDLKLSE